MFRSVATLSLLASVASAAELRADSKAGRALLKHAQVIEHARHLQNNYNWYNEEQERDASFVVNYYIKYTGCSTTLSYDQEDNGGDGNPLVTSNLVKFSLCSDCGSCKDGGQYAVGMQEFVQAYNEMQMQEQEYECEAIRYKCEQAAQYNQNQNQNQNNNGNYDEEYACFSEYGVVDKCYQYEGQEEFELERYLECGEVEYNNNNNNNGNNNGNNNNQNNGNNQNNWYYDYFMGPYCASNGKDILMGLYYDDGCTAPADDTSIFKQRTGMDMPYAKSSIIPHGTCMSCKDPESVREYEQNYGYNQNQNNQNNNNGNWYYEFEPSQICQESYERAVRCEKGMSINYPDTTGCLFLNEYLPQLESASKSFQIINQGGKTARGFAVLFAVTTLLFGAYAYFLYRKIKRGSVNLSSQEALA